MDNQIVSRKNQIRSVFFIIVLMVITLIVIFREYSITQLVSVIKTASPIYLLAGILLMFLYIGCQGINMTMILTTLGHPVSFLRCIQYVFVGNYFGAITPCASGAQPAQLYYMNKDKIHVDLSAMCVFYLLFVSQIVILILGGILVVFQLPLLMALPGWMNYLLICGSLFVLSVILVLSAFMFSKKTVPFIIHLGFRIGVRWHILKNPEVKKGKMEAMLLSYREKSKIILKHPDLFIRVLSVTIVQWLFYYMITYMVYRSFGHNAYSGFALMTAQAIINISLTAIPLPGSVGVAEKAFLIIFQPYYTSEQLPLAMLLNRIINFYLMLFISFSIYMFVHFRVTRKKR